MSDADERTAASIILKDLALFNKAAILFDKMEPAIRTVVSDLARDWLEKCGWKGKVDFGDFSFWVCPSKWKEENAEPIARFVFTRRPNVESLSYNLADMCGIGQADFGFQFVVTWSSLGGSAGRAAFAKSTGELADELLKNGWINAGRLVFFRPIKLPAELLADAWESEDWTKFLAPLERALDALVADQDVFDRIIMAAKPKTELAAS